MVKKEKQSLTQRQRMAVTLKKAHGQIAVLAVGISDYDKQSGFPRLKTCSNDAQKVRDIFHDVWQLNADKERVKSITSGSSVPPSKGEIIKAVKNIASLSGANERLLFYFSGHGQRLYDEDGNSKFYLVPQDVYDDTDPEALIDFDKLLKMINSAEAKQRIVIIDACMGGPVATGKKILPAKYSKKFLAEYMKKTKGVAVMSSSTFDQASYTYSPNPKLSLFTYYLIKALGGDPKAQDESMLLTLNSLFDYISTKVQRRAKSYQKEQLPCIDVKASGIFILGNFAQAIISPESFDIDGYPISNIVFKDWEPLDVKDVLTEIKRWTAYSQEYLEGRVNDNLHEFLEEDLGKKRSALRKNMGFSPSEIGIEDNCIIFPGGSYDVEYKSDDKKSGKLICALKIESDWF
ncbi:MAG: caspase family protein, partial [Thermotogota bacterium]|nr:caspase family protein [Thermotogota bacterium]